MKSNSFKNIVTLWNHLNNKNKILFGITTFLSICAAILETQVLVTFIPLIKRLTSSPDQNTSDLTNQYNIIFKSLSSVDTSTQNFLLIFSFLVIVSALLRLTFLYLASINAASIGSQLSKLCFKSIIYKPYVDLIEEDTGKSIEMILGNIARTIKVILSCSVVISSLFLTTAILYSLIIVDLKITILFATIISFCYFLLFKFAKSRLYSNGKIIFSSSQSIISLGKETIYSIKDIIIKKLHLKYINKFEEIDVKLRKRQAEAQFISLYPRYILEAVAILLLTNIAYNLGKSNLNYNILPKLGFFSLGFIRLLPAIQQIYSRTSKIKTFLSSIEALNTSLLSKNKFKKLEIKNTLSIQPKNFKLTENLIEAKNISFKYPRSKNNIIENTNIKIERGKHYAIIGKSGSGKSTLLDLLLGILDPSAGNIFFNGFNIKDDKLKNFYHSNIAYVPQSPIIFNESIKNNITLQKDANFKKDHFYNVIKSVKLEKFININGIDFICGEEGINLSGGQKQRLALARALYSQKSILFLDECSSAIDNETENFILDEIKKYYLNKTIISITHNMNHLERFNSVINLENK